MQAAKMLSDIIQIYSNAGHLTTVLMTGARGDATEFVKKYHDMADVIVCSGGDGTYNEIMSGCLECGANIPIGYIPSGSTNDFASSVGLQRGVLAAAECILSGKPRDLDVGSFNGRYFSYVASFGAFTSTSYSVPQNLKNMLGHTAYVLQGMKDVMNIKSIHAKFICDEGTPNEQISEGDYIFGAVCNSTSVAGILKLDHFDVDMNDGLMEVLLVKTPKSLADLNDIVVNMMDGKLETDKIEFYSAKSIRVEIDHDTHWTLDGEYEEGADVVEIETVRSAVKLIV